MALGKRSPGFGEDMDVLQKHILKCQPGTCQDLFEDVPTCMTKNPVTITFKGSRKPIFSKSFCDRFQLDIINF
jgi:hypothetical protein